MSYLLDILGSTAISAAVIFMVLQFNNRVSDSSGEILLSTITQRDAITSAEIIEYDLYKMGFNVSGSSIAIADSNTIKFYSDLDNDGSKDSITYYLGSEKDLTSTANPNDKPILRKHNDDNGYNIVNVTDFEISYYDSIGTELTSAQLTNQSARDRIKTISVYLHAESVEPIDTLYQGIDWFRIIRPKNI